MKAWSQHGENYPLNFDESKIKNTVPQRRRFSEILNK